MTFGGVRGPLGRSKEGSWKFCRAGTPLATRGMPAFNAPPFGMTAEDSHAIQAYVIEQAWLAYEKQKPTEEALP